MMTTRSPLRNVRAVVPLRVLRRLPVVIVLLWGVLLSHGVHADTPGHHPAPPSVSAPTALAAAPAGASTAELPGDGHHPVHPAEHCAPAPLPSSTGAAAPDAAPSVDPVAASDPPLPPGRNTAATCGPRRTADHGTSVIHRV
ncbi:hypothetical protein ACSMX9_00270 [Streptomyces sp. LE64]|uniref:hypothetical protein n=1 Tax=Streptomyces sp. LE64 TaxID=3448653 RepID=UPI0040424FFA